MDILNGTTSLVIGGAGGTCQMGLLEAILIAVLSVAIVFFVFICVYTHCWLGRCRRCGFEHFDGPPTVELRSVSDQHRLVEPNNQRNLRHLIKKPSKDIGLQVEPQLEAAYQITEDDLQQAISALNPVKQEKEQDLQKNLFFN